MPPGFDRLDDAALVALLEREANERGAVLRRNRLGGIWRAAFVTQDETGAETTLRSAVASSPRRALRRLAAYSVDSK
jgi:hypothetical protein